MSTYTDSGLSSRSANDRIQQAIVQQFKDSSYHELRQIQVAVTSEQILLTGNAPSFFIKQVAQETARQACPVRKIQNSIRVE